MYFRGCDKVAVIMTKGVEELWGIEHSSHRKMIRLGLTLVPN